MSMAATRSIRASCLHLNEVVCFVADFSHHRPHLFLALQRRCCTSLGYPLWVAVDSLIPVVSRSHRRPAGLGYRQQRTGGHPLLFGPAADGSDVHSGSRTHQRHLGALQICRHRSDGGGESGDDKGKLAEAWVYGDRHWNSLCER